jgi:hypothetical protein
MKVCAQSQDSIIVVPNLENYSSFLLQLLTLENFVKEISKDDSGSFITMFVSNS